MLLTYDVYFSYSADTLEYEVLVKKIASGENAYMNKVYRPEFVILAPPLLDTQVEVI